MRVALTGTPGTGKTTLAKNLARRGYHVVDLRAFARGLSLSQPTQDGDILDLETLATKLPAADGEPTIIEGHLSHLLPVGQVIILRCHPEALRRRLRDKGWPPEKIEENVQAEAVDVVLVESLENCPDVREVDTTERSPLGVLDEVVEILEGRDSGHRPGSVDWSDVILSWY